MKPIQLNISINFYRQDAGAVEAWHEHGQGALSYQPGSLWGDQEPEELQADRRFEGLHCVWQWQRQDRHTGVQRSEKQVYQGRLLYFVGMESELNKNFKFKVSLKLFFTKMIWIYKQIF